MELIGLNQSPLQGAAPKTGLIAAVLQMSGFFFKRREEEEKKKEKAQDLFHEKAEQKQIPASGLGKKRRLV